MRTSSYIRRSYLEMNLAQRRKFLVFVAIQTSISFLDIVGVALIGLVLPQAQGDLGRSRFSEFLPSEIFGVTKSMGILILVVAAAVCFIVKGIIVPSMQRKILISLGRISSNLSGRLINELFSKDVIFVKRRTSQETSFILTDATFIAIQGILGSSALLFSEFALIVFMITLLLLLNLPLTIFIVVYFASALLLLNRFSKSASKNHSNILNSSSIKAWAYMQEGLNSYREIYVSQNMNNLVASTTNTLALSVNSRATLTWISLIPKYFLDACLIFGMILVGGFTVLLNSQDEAFSLCILFLASASRIMPSLLRMNTGLNGVHNGIDASDRLFSFILELESCESLPNDPSVAITEARMKSIVIKVDKLHFKYPDSQVEIIQDLSFEVPFGEFLAIVGPSGSGKSTLVDLIMGVITTFNSSIKLGDLNPQILVKQNPGLIGYVPQKVSIMNRTLKENIAFGIPIYEIDESKVAKALDLSALSDFVKTLPNGLETIIGENGHNFSGGQIQRIGLARALYSNPRILILDEATSALDAETENAITQSLNSLAGGITLIVVAHRLATIRNADKILYLGEGGVSALGTFEELKEKIPSFQKQAHLLGI